MEQVPQLISPIIFIIIQPWVLEASGARATRATARTTDWRMRARMTHPRLRSRTSGLGLAFMGACAPGFDKKRLYIFRGLLRSGNANNSANDGLANANTNNAPSNANTNIRSQLSYRTNEYIDPGSCQKMTKKFQ